MENAYELTLSIVSKLMNEQEMEYTEIKKIHDELFSMVIERLPEVLDGGLYENNAKIVRVAGRILSSKEIFTIIPELALRTLVTIWGNSKHVSEKFKILTEKKLGIGLNSNLPLFLIPVDHPCDVKICAVTYMNKKEPISFEEYEHLTRELYKNDIDVKKLIKSFVIYYYESTVHQSYCVLPPYISQDNDLIKTIEQVSDIQIVVPDEEEKWKKISKSLFESKVYFLGNITNISALNTDDVVFLDDEEFKKLCNASDKATVNYALSVELESLLLKVSVFYTRLREKLKKRTSGLSKDSIQLRESEAKEAIQKYRDKMLKMQESVTESYSEFLEIKNEIIKLAENFELVLSNTLLHDIKKEVNVIKYTRSLIRVFFKLIYCEDYEAAKNVILKLARANYSYCDAFRFLIKYCQEYELTPSEILILKGCPNELPEIAKLKLFLSDTLELTEKECIMLTANIQPLETGREYYFYAKMLMENNNFQMAKDYFLKALDFDYDMAGIELIHLSASHPELMINIEELAENLVSEANFQIGITNLCLSQKYKKGIVNLKMAASKNHLAAVEKLADMLFDKYRYFSWMDMKKEENMNSVFNVIKLYTFLDEKIPNEKFKLKIGLMFCKLSDYSRAYVLLKEINDSAAYYECAKMHQYGNGVAKNLDIAKMYYEKIIPDYRDSSEQYKKVCSMIESRSLRQNDSYYSESQNYSSTSSYSYSSSDSFCFITTAACLALGANDNCDELNTLRRFRDSYISNDGMDGNKLIKEYYRIGPEIIKNIDCEWNPFAIYAELWEEYIYPTFDMIKSERNSEAKLKYIAMVKFLCEKYNVSVSNEIMKKYSIKHKQKSEMNIL